MNDTFTTTFDPFDYDRDYFYYYMNGPAENWQYVDDEYEGLIVFNPNDLLTTSEAVFTVSRVASFIGFFSNLVHFFVLTRKDLRSSYVFIVMMGICVCDILILLYPIGVFILKEDLHYEMGNCLFATSYHQQLIEWIAIGVESFGRKCSMCLALFMSLFRTVSVMFPMNGSVQRLSSARSGICTVLGLAVVCGAWETVRFSYWKIEKLKKCTSVVPNGDYTYVLDKTSWMDFYYIFDGYFMVTTSILYVFVTTALVLELKKAQRRRKNLRADKSDGTANFVISMTVSFFLYGFLYGGYFLFDYYLLMHYEFLRTFVGFVSEAIGILTVVHSTAHCFICFFMSTQYRDTVKRLVWKKNKEASTINFVEPATNTTVKTTKTSGKQSF